MTGYPERMDDDNVIWTCFSGLVACAFQPRDYFCGFKRSFISDWVLASGVRMTMATVWATMQDDFTSSLPVC